MLLLLVLLPLSFAAASTAAPPLPFPLYQAHASSHFSLGALIGRAALPRIADWTLSYAPLSTTLRPYVRTKAGAAAFQRLRNASCAAFPYICEEVDGLASGSGQSPATMYLMALRHELSYLAKHDHIRECTDVLTHGMFAHNEDAAVGLASTGFYVNGSVTTQRVTNATTQSATTQSETPGETPPASTITTTTTTTTTAYTAFHYPATTAGHAFGFSLLPASELIAFSMNAVFPSRVDLDGAGCYFFSRAMMDTTTLGQLRALLRGTRSAYGASLNVGLRNTSVINFELGPGRGFVAETLAPSSQSHSQPGSNSGSGAGSDGRGATGGAMFHMNEYLHLTHVAFDKDPSSEHRLARARAIEREAGGAVHSGAPATFTRILGDTKDSVFPLYRDGAAPDDSATAATAIFDLRNMTLSVAERGNPAAPETYVRVFQMD